ncbi:MAG: hypothetical protein GZ085_06660 [Sulfuriferula multivorans]|uniref:HupE/UreJ family protein n=1 Tax=Sulfuriferula multivorans TaxID=1559896 RepID=A0A7C9P724_9PROT|nr:hypothetical protein [Sulfuriferula multivorans]
MKRPVFAILPLLFSPLAHAHPGGHHAGVLDGILHLLTEPDHLAMEAIALVAAVVSARVYRRHARTHMKNKHR